MSEMAIAYRRRPISVDEYHRMDEAGVFAPDERVELLDGELISVPPMGPRQAGGIGRINRLLTIRLNDRAHVRVQLPTIVRLRPFVAQHRLPNAGRRAKIYYVLKVYGETIRCKSLNGETVSRSVCRRPWLKPSS